MSIPNYQNVVADLAEQYPAEWRAAHTGGPQTEAFIRRLAWVLHRRDPRVGLTGKRGNPADISDDALCYDGVSERGDLDPTRGGAPVTVLDVIYAAGDPSKAAPAWGSVGPATPQPHAAWVQPQPVDGEVPTPPPTPQPQPAPSPTPSVDLGPVLAKLAELQAALDAVQDEQEAQRESIAAAAAYAKDVRAALQNGLGIEGQTSGSRWVASQTITGVARG